MEKVIIILCDTLRAKSLPHYGNKRNTLPHLSNIIDRDFIVYNRAYAPAPWTTPSHLSFFTGLYPSQVMETRTSWDLNPVFRSLPELFKDSGYHTLALSANALITKKFGFDKGFDTFLQLWLPKPEEDEVLLSLEGGNRFEKLLTLLKLILRKNSRGKTFRGLRENLYKNILRNILKDATPSTNRAMRLIKQYISDKDKEKLFCFINLMQVHNLYNPPRSTRNRFVKNNPKYENYYKKRTPLDHYAIEPFSEGLMEYIKLRYEEEILYLDIVISDFIQFLKKNGLYDESTIIITSDHGEHFGEHGHVAHNFSVYEPLIRIPLYIKWSGKLENSIKAGNELVMLQDLYSTFLSLLNHWCPFPESSVDLSSSEKRTWVVSQLPDMHYDIKGCLERRGTFSIREIGLETDSLTAYIFDDGMKIVENGNKILCYDLTNDPDEEKPLSPPVEHMETMGKIKDILS